MPSKLVVCINIDTSNSFPVNLVIIVILLLLFIWTVSHASIPSNILLVWHVNTINSRVINLVSGPNLHVY